MTAAEALHAQGAAFRYAGGPAVVGPFDLVARGGELRLVTAPSGSGKSTLARLLAGTIPHLYRGDFLGRVLIGGERSDALPLWQLCRRVGLVAQNPAAQLLGSTARDEIAFGLETLGLPDGEISARTEAALHDFALGALAGRSPRTLSGGEQQRLVLAAMAARRPSAIVLDEPLSMLDAKSTRSVVAHLDRLRSQGAALVIFDHRGAAFRGLDGVTSTALASTTPDDEAALPLPALVPPFRVVVEGLRVRLGGRAVLDGIDLTLTGGRVVSIVGDNGAGKTTLLRALAGLQRHAGRITSAVRGSSRPARLGLCFQDPDCQLFNPTVRDEIRYAIPHPDERHVRAVLELLGLTRYEGTPPLLLSDGEKKRLGLAIVLARPGLCGVCLDEPTLGQDGRHRRLLGWIARRLAEAGYLCLVATHDLEWAHAWSDEVLVLADGRLLEDGPPEAFRARREPSSAARVEPRENATHTPYRLLAPACAPVVEPPAARSRQAGRAAALWAKRRANRRGQGRSHRSGRGFPGAGQIAERSLLRRADARTKLVLSLAAPLAVMLPLPKLAAFAGAFAALVVAARLTSSALAPLRRLAPLLCLLFAADWLLIGPSFALLITLRLALLATAFSILTSSTTPDELRGALEALRMPHRLAFALATALRSIELLDRDWTGIIEAQRARGLPAAAPAAVGWRRWRTRLTEARAVIVPAIVLATRRAWSLHEAAAVRGLESPRGGLRPAPPLATVDHALLAAAGGLLACLWTWR